MKTLAWYIFVLGFVLAGCSYLELANKIMFYTGLANILGVVGFLVIEKIWEIFELTILAMDYSKLHPVN